MREQRDPLSFELRTEENDVHKKTPSFRQGVFTNGPVDEANAMDLTEQEISLVNLFRAMRPEERDRFFELIKQFADQQIPLRPRRPQTAFGPDEL